jgi:hypothetical protein
VVLATGDNVTFLSLMSKRAETGYSIYRIC